MELLIAEVAHLPEDERRSIVRAQREYIAQWVQLLGKAHPAMTFTDARVRLQASLNVVNDIARTPQLRRQPHIQQNVKAIASSILELEPFG